MNVEIVRFVSAVNACYDFPKQALLRMEEFAAASGWDAFLEKLARQPEFFESTTDAEISPASFRRHSKQRWAAASLLSVLASGMIEPETN